MSTPIGNWTFADVSTWLRRIGLGKYAELFAKHEINGEILLTMTEKDLSAAPLNISTFGTIRKFGIEIEILKKTARENPVEKRYSPFETNGAASVIDILEEKSQPEDLPCHFNGFASGDPVVDAPIELPEDQCAADIDDQPIVDAETQAVMIKGTRLDRALQMDELHSDFCWRYQTNTDIVKQCSNDGFDAEVVVPISPVEFYVHHSVCVSKAQKLLTDMNKFYTDDMEAVPADKIFENMPCAVNFRDDPGWFRAVVQEIGIEDARVVFVDWGNGQFTKFSDIKPLTKEFGRFPPLAIRCRIEGVRERSLEQKVVQTFLDEIESLKSQVRVVPISFNGDIVTVRLLHPQTRVNLGEKYLPKDPLCPPDIDDEIEEKLRIKERVEEVEKATCLPFAEYDRHDPKIVEQMKVKAEKLDKGLYASDMEAFLDGAPGFDEADSDDEDFKPRKKLKQVKREILLKAQGKMPINERETIFTYQGVDYVQDYPKQNKPQKGEVVVFIVKIVSAREIYLRSELHRNCLERMNVTLHDVHENPNSPTLPEHLIKTGTACAYKDADDGRWYRARIGEMGPHDVELPLILVDYGRVVTTARSNRQRIKALRAHQLLSNEFLIYKCKIHKLCDPPTTSIETDLLKEMLLEGQCMACHFDREREPYRVHLQTMPPVEDFNEMFEVQMAKRGLEQKAAHQRSLRLSMTAHQPTSDNQRKFEEVTASYHRKEMSLVVGTSGVRPKETVAAAAPASPVSNKLVAVKKSLPSPPPSYSPSTRFLHAPMNASRAAVDEDLDDDDGPEVQIIDEGDSDE